MIDEVKEISDLLSDLKAILLRDKLGAKKHEVDSDEDELGVPEEGSKKVTIVETGKGQDYPEAYPDKKGIGENKDESEESSIINGMLNDYEKNEEPASEVVQMGSRKVKRMRM